MEATSGPNNQLSVQTCSSLETELCALLSPLAIEKLAFLSSLEAWRALLMPSLANIDKGLPGPQAL